MFNPVQSVTGHIFEPYNIIILASGAHNIHIAVTINIAGFNAIRSTKIAIHQVLAPSLGQATE